MFDKKILLIFIKSTLSKYTDIIRYENISNIHIIVNNMIYYEADVLQQRKGKLENTHLQDSICFNMNTYNRLVRIIRNNKLKQLGI